MIPAARKLLDSDRLPADTAFCPGQTIAGPSEDITDDFFPQADTMSVVEYILNKHFDLWNWNNERFRKIEYRRIADQLPTSDVVSSSDAAAAYEKWVWEERQAKFFTGDIRQYEFLGADWWLPLWDREFVDFWTSVPLKYRRNKRLVRKYGTRKYAKVANISLREARISDRHYGLVNRMKTRAINSSLRPILRPIYHRFMVDETVLSGEHWGWYGIVPDEQLNELGTAAHNIYSFRVLEALGRLSFDPPKMEPKILRKKKLYSQ